MSQSRRSSPWGWRWAIVLGLFGVSLLVRLPFCSDNIFTYDAADYLRAARAGFWNQYVGADSISLPAFYEKYKGDSEFRGHPWGPLYIANDGASLRHFHVPLGFYLPSLIERLNGGRKSQLVAVAVVSSGTVAATFIVLTSLEVHYLLAALTGLFLAFSPVLILAGTNLSPHPLFTLTAILSLYAFVRWIEAPGKHWFALLLVLCAMSIATLELSPLLAVTLVCSLAAQCWWKRNDARCLSFRLKTTVWGALALIMLLFLMWPGGILRGGYLMSYGTFIFQGLFRSSLYFRDRGLTTGVVHLGHGSLLGLTYVVCLMFGIYSAIRFRRYTPLTAFTIFAVLLFGQGMANGFRNPTYASHAVYAIGICATLGLNALWFRGGKCEQWGAGALLLLIAVLTGAEAFRPFAASPADVARDPVRVLGAIRQLRKQFPPGTRFVVTQDPQAFILNASDYQFAGAVATDSSLPQPWTHIDHYRLLVDLEEAYPTDVALCDGDGLGKFGFAISCQDITSVAASIISAKPRVPASE